MNELIKANESGAMVATQKEIQNLIDFETSIATLKKVRDEKVAELKERMKQLGIKKFETDDISICYTPARFQERLDTKRLKDEAPEVYLEFSKEVEVADSIKITIRKKDK